MQGVEEAEQLYLTLVEIEKFDSEEVPCLKNGLKKANGNYIPNYIRNLSIIKSLELRDNDTFVIGYPKSGTTWVEEIVWLIQNNLDIETARQVFHFKRVLFVDRGILPEIISLAPSPRIFKTHLLPEYLPDNLENKSKIIYVVRNPKDLAVSQYNYFRSSAWDPFEGSFEDLYELFLQGKIWYGPWWKHVDSYVNMPNIKIVHYEDLLERPFEKVREIAEYLGKSLSQSEIETIMKSSSFDFMKSSPAFDFRMLIKYDVFDESVEFFRKGQVGQWHNYFNKEMSRRFDEMVEKKLKYRANFNYGSLKSIENSVLSRGQAEI